jgi:hypothetical protein
MSMYESHRAVPPYIHLLLFLYLFIWLPAAFTGSFATTTAASPNRDSSAWTAGRSASHHCLCVDTICMQAQAEMSAVARQSSPYLFASKKNILSYDDQSCSPVER